MERAIALCNTLLTNMAWKFSIVSREYLIKELIPAVYNLNPMNTRTYSRRDLALLLTALAIGALVELGQEPHNEEAQRYIRLAWSAARSVLVMPCIATIKCLHFMSIYHAMTGNGWDFKDSHRLLNSAWQFIHHVRSIIQDFAILELISVFL